MDAAHCEPWGPRFEFVFRHVTKDQQTVLKCDTEGHAEWAAANLKAKGEGCSRWKVK